MRIASPLEQSRQQLSAFLMAMPPQPVRQKIWQAWKNEKQFLENDQYDNTAQRNKKTAINSVQF